jgi:hypothetical protein
MTSGTTGRSRIIVPERLPGRAARAFADGANLAPDRAVGQRTWEEFLADTTGTPVESSRVIPARAAP